MDLDAEIAKLNRQMKEMQEAVATMGGPTLGAAPALLAAGEVPPELPPTLSNLADRLDDVEARLDEYDKEYEDDQGGNADEAPDTTAQGDPVDPPKHEPPAA